MIRALLRLIDNLWRMFWDASLWGVATRALDKIVDRKSPPLDPP